VRGRGEEETRGRTGSARAEEEEWLGFDGTVSRLGIKRGEGKA
jgi:hypothetical protein